MQTALHLSSANQFSLLIHCRAKEALPNQNYGAKPTLGKQRPPFYYEQALVPWALSKWTQASVKISGSVKQIFIALSIDKPYKVMSKLTVTNFDKRSGSPFQKVKENTDTKIVHEDVLEKNAFEKQKEKQNELLQKVNKKTAEYQSNKPSCGVFTEVVTHGAFTSKAVVKPKVESPPPPKTPSNGSKSFLGFPSSANDLALDAKSDLESDANISNEVKEKVIQKLFALVSMVQHVYESKVRIMTEYEKYKDTHMKNEIRREKEHSEQLYKLNMNFQNEVVQSIQRLKSELDISRNVSRNIEESSSNASLKDTSIDFNTTEEILESDSNEKGIDTVEGDGKNLTEITKIIQDVNIQNVNKEDELL